MNFYHVIGGEGKQFYDGEFGPYPDSHALFYGPHRPEQGIRLWVVRGSRRGDMMFSALNVVSRRLLDVLERVGATGYVARPVAVKKDERKIRDYFFLEVTGRGGALEFKNSYLDHSSSGRYKKYVIRMDESKWDGSDVFRIPGRGFSTYVVERVAEALENAGLQNVLLTRNAEVLVRGDAVPPTLRIEVQRAERRKKETTNTGKAAARPRSANQASHLLEAGTDPRYCSGKPSLEIVRLTPEEILAWVERTGRPVEIEVIGGRIAGDMVAAFYCPICSPRLVAVLKALGATGYETFPVSLIGGARKEPLDYVGLCVSGRVHIDTERVERLWQLEGQAPTDGDLFSVRGLFIDGSNRDNSDLFLVEDLGFNVFVTERVATALRQAPLSNVRLLPSREVTLFQLPPGIWTPFPPPEARAAT